MPSGSRISLYRCAYGTSWHKSKTLVLPENIELFVLLPYTPEMNPIEQIWKELRKVGFKNEIFSTLEKVIDVEKVIDRLCETINLLTKETVRSIIGLEWVLSMFRLRVVLIYLE